MKYVSCNGVPKVEQIKNMSKHDIFFKSEEHEMVEEYAGWAQHGSNDLLRLYILAEQFVGRGKLRPEVEARLNKWEYRFQHCIYMVCSETEIELVCGPTPAKL